MIEAQTEGESQLTPPALPGDGIICFAHDWRGDPTSKTHIMRILSARLRVLWVDSIQGLVHLAEGPADFIAAIELSLAERDPDKTRRRVEAMREESWNRRVDQMSAIIAAHARPGPRIVSV